MENQISDHREPFSPEHGWARLEPPPYQFEDWEIEWYRKEWKAISGIVTRRPYKKKMFVDKLVVTDEFLANALDVHVLLETVLNQRFQLGVDRYEKGKNDGPK